jgi:hypothetical protein
MFSIYFRQSLFSPIISPPIRAHYAIYFAITPLFIYADIADTLFSPADYFRAA